MIRHMVWLRDDPRLSDNPALWHACEQADQVMVVICIYREQWQEHGEGERKIQARLHQYMAMKKELEKLGIACVFLECGHFDKSAGMLAEKLGRWQIQTLHFNREYALNEMRRDDQVSKLLKAEGFAVHTYQGNVLFEPGECVNGQMEPYKVFTAFKRRFWQRFLQQVFRVYPAIASVNTPWQLDDEAECDNRILLSGKPVLQGEAQAWAQAGTFLDKAVFQYQKNRDYPDLGGTSGLSPYISLGVLSVRQIFLAALERSQRSIESLEEGIESWLNELIWREFYWHLMALLPELNRNRPLKPATERIPWKKNPEMVKRWQEGRTGFPMVDAGMRQLHETGWMHNRLRMLCATFFSKHMFQDWREGESWFMQQLLDGDFASNNGGWQWASSTGADAAPWFRIFNPWRQGERFDADGSFCRKWLPELEGVPGKLIHKPGMAHKTSGGRYPEPMLDASLAAQDAKAVFASLQKAGHNKNPLPRI